MLEELNKKYDRLQLKYGSKELDSIYNGGCTESPDICFVFMNPTGRNIASLKTWKGRKSPWIGTKNIWTLFYNIGLLDEEIFNQIKNKKAIDWTYEFADEVYECVNKHKYFITNLGKCTQVDARPLKDEVYLEYLKLLYKEFEIIKPKVIVLFGNQVSSIVLGTKVSVSECRCKMFTLKVKNQEYKVYSVYYPVGNGSFNAPKAIEDLKYIIEEVRSKYV